MQFMTKSNLVQMMIQAEFPNETHHRILNSFVDFKHNVDLASM